MKKSQNTLWLCAILLSLLVGLNACSEKQQAIRNLEKLNKTVAENAASYTTDDWKNIYDQYQDISEYIDHYYESCTIKEQRHIDELKDNIKKNAKEGMKASISAKFHKGIESIFGKKDSVETTEE